MPLEATMMVIDNSEYMRNGDYLPTRFDAQSDAVNTVFQTKIDSNPENTVGIMSMAGKGPEVLVTHSKDLGQILSAVHTTSQRIGGQIAIPTAVAVAQLALKHRENKNLRQRIIVFVGSPVTEDKSAMVKLAKKLKKNNVAVDVVCYGDGIEEGTGTDVMKSFVENVNSGDNSHLVNVPPSSRLISDVLISSPILAGDRAAGIPDELMGEGGSGGAGAGGQAGGGDNFEFGVDPSLDPELAMALRLSMQEASQQQQSSSSTSESTNNPPTAQPSSTAPAAAAAAATGVAAGAASATMVPGDGDEDEDALLQQAIALSQQEGEGQSGDRDVDMAPAEGDEEGDDEEEDDDDDDDDDEEDEDAAIARAIEMSLQQGQGQADGKGNEKK